MDQVPATPPDDEPTAQGGGEFDLAAELADLTVPEIEPPIVRLLRLLRSNLDHVEMTKMGQRIRTLGTPGSLVDADEVLEALVAAAVWVEDIRMTNLHGDLIPNLEDPADPSVRLRDLFGEDEPAAAALGRMYTCAASHRPSRLATH